MSVWFVLWLLLSSILLYFLVWTLVILRRQKKAWAGFARKNKLRYHAKSMFAPPEISGALGDYTVNLFPSEYMPEGARTSRKLTAIEVQLSTMLPVEGALASGGMVRIAEGFGFREEMRPDHKGWDQSFVAIADSKAILSEYLSDARLDALTDLMKIKSAWVILVFRGNTSLLRFDTPDPLASPKKLESLVQKMLSTAAVLELKDGEVSRLKTLGVRKSQKGAVLDLDETALEESNLSLEDDQNENPSTENS